MLLKEPEPALQVCLGEPLSEATQDVVGVIATSTEATQFSSEYLGLEHRRLPASLCGKGWCGVEIDVARFGDRPRPKPD